MPGDAVFAGKLGFRSTNADGTQYYLTGYLSTGIPPTPSVSAPSLGAQQTVTLYATADDAYLVALLVPGATTGTITVAWCVGQPEMLLVTTTSDPDEAQPITIDGLDQATSTWSIAAPTGGGTVTLGYIPAPSRSPLVYLQGAPAGFLTTLANEPVTPGYAAITAAGAAPANADFTYADLSGLDFSGIDLTGADFTGANLAGTDFSGATLTGATFTGAALDGTSFSGATLRDAVLAGTDLTTVTWGRALAASGADFSGCTAVGTTLSAGTGADLSGASFVGADLGRAGLVGANLSSATMYGANLTGANLSSANLDSSRLGGSEDQAPAVLAYVVMANATFDQADLFGVDCSFATIYGAETTLGQAATLQLANFSNAYLEGISFASSNLQSAIFDGACLVNVDFTGAKLDAPSSGFAAASLVATCLQGATFTSAVLGQANLANAAISSGDGSLPVRYCSTAGIFPPTAGKAMPLDYPATTALDETTLAPATICPNGSTYAANLARGVTLAQMLDAAGAPTSWSPAACLVAAPASAEGLDSPGGHLGP
jgi:uncharacterized protein YjbI with pentapeptide repeats